MGLLDTFGGMIPPFKTPSVVVIDNRKLAALNLGLKLLALLYPIISIASSKSTYKVMEVPTLVPTFWFESSGISKFTGERASSVAAVPSCRRGRDGDDAGDADTGSAAFCCVCAGAARMRVGGCVGGLILPRAAGVRPTLHPRPRAGEPVSLYASQNISGANTVPDFCNNPDYNYHWTADPDDYW